MDNEHFYDLYLYFMGSSDKLYTLKHLTRKTANTLALKWFNAGDDRDYMLVTEESKPYDEFTTVTEVTEDWIDQQ